MAVRAGLVHSALHPTNLSEVDAEFVVQDAIDEDGSSHRVERHADAFAFEVLGRLDAGLLVDGDETHAEGDRRENRDGDERALIAGEALGKLGKRIFCDVEFLTARHAVKDRARLIDGDEVEVDAVGLHLARVERLHPVVEAARKRKLQLRHGPSVLPCSDCGLRLARRSQSRKAAQWHSVHGLNAIPCGESCRYCSWAIDREIRRCAAPCSSPTSRGEICEGRPHRAPHRA
jgi:hypothetical protein